MSSQELFGWREKKSEKRIEPWRPHALDVTQWPPNYEGVYQWRLNQLERLEDPLIAEAARIYYADKPAEFIMHWVDTYDPRKTGDKWIPFIFFKKQEDLINFFHSLRKENEGGLVEKCRDAGVTWGACAYSVHSWLFIDDDSIGWGSRKEQLVDTIGDPDSIFEKMRLIIKRLPEVFLPVGFNPKLHATYMKLVNPENGATITGEAGDNIGRGGRKSVYFKDESAHYERPEKIESAVGDNTNVPIDISSVNGIGNVFHRRREAGLEWHPGAKLEPGFVRVFVFDWRDHPAKTQEWYDLRKARYVREGMAHIFAQEVDRNYSAAIQNTVIPFEWIEAAVDAHLLMPDQAASETWLSALDVADEGDDRNAQTMRQGIILRDADEWGERDAGVTTRRAISNLRARKGIVMQYDSIGIGATVKAEYNRLIDEGVIDRDIVELIAWNAGGSVLRPLDRIIPDDNESPLNRDFFQNLKAQGWWSLRTRFFKVFKFVKEGIVYPVDEMISLDSKLKNLAQVKKELAQATITKSSSLKLMIEKKPEGTRSPNIADSVVMNYHPQQSSNGKLYVGRAGL